MKVPQFVVVLIAHGYGCGSPPGSLTNSPTCAVPQAIEPGFDAPEAQWDAIGALGTVSDSGQFSAFCTGVAVGVRTILTAKHCVSTAVAGIDRANGALYFGVGADSSHPRSVVPITSTRLARPVSGGYTGLGSDMALATVASTLVDVAPLPIAPDPLSIDEIGRTFTVVGYGTSTTDGQDAGDRLRRRGAQTLRALNGNIFDLIYGGWDQFLTQGRQDEGLGADACHPGEYSPGAVNTQLARQYASGSLIKQYEAWAGGTTGDSQTCHGDSGGPLLASTGGVLTIVGIASWSLRSNRATCDYGTVFAIFGPGDRALLAEGIE